MSEFSRSLILSKARIFQCPETKHLACATHLNSLLVSTAAVLLVIASAGFGALFAWRVGSQHDVALGVLSVAMALGLELAKPFSISAAFTSLSQFRIVTAAALLLVGLLAIGYSLQAELTFMSATRGDMVSERASEADTAQRAEQRYRRAEAELAALQPTGTTKSATTAFLARREALTAELKAAEQDRRSAPAIVVADPGAVALSTYASALGFKWDAEQLGRWLPLVGVLALEIGAAFSVVLVRATAGAGPTVAQQPVQQMQGSPASPVVDQPSAAPGPTAERVPKPAKRLRDRRPPDDDAGPVAGRQRGLPRVLAALQTGAVQGSQRTIAAALGSSKSTVLRAQRMLEDQGMAFA